uniref:Jade n=1 Tax=Ciona intestinalis TaxID=7719 RepID=F6XEQ3_CIOIN
MRSAIQRSTSLSQKRQSRIPNRHKPAEIFRKDLISAMKIPDTSQLLNEEYWIMQDPWRIEWEKGVQVPVNAKSVPTPRKMLKSSPDIGDRDMIDLNVLADSTCRYDLDEMDVAWLKIINHERKMMGLATLDEFSMEQIMEELETQTQCHDNMQLAIKTKEGLGIEYDEDVVCDVCRIPDCEEGNEMVFCDGCNLCVHQACYGILKVPVGSWLCKPCALGIRGSAMCILCNKKGGAMKSTRSGNKWAHVSCALWIPEITIADPDRMEPITKVSHVPSSRWALLCSICKDRVGACIQCSVRHCVTAYHVTCAIEDKLDMIADCGVSPLEGQEDAVIFRSYCKKHSTNRKESDGEDEQTEERIRGMRHRRIMELEQEFYTLVKYQAVANALSIPSQTARDVMEYWKLKRAANFNRPLITPKHEEGTALAEAAETNLQRRLRMFTHLRQDLERVRNLCYMIGRREKTKRATVKNMESVFLTQKSFSLFSDEVFG